MSLTLGLVGCGVMGRRHVLGLKRLHDVGRLRFELVALCDPLETNANSVADIAEELLGVRPRTFPDIEAMQDELTVDALDITTTPALHAPIGIAALEAGMHIQVEKPITLTIAEGRELVEVATRTGRVLSVAENYRRDPINRLAKALIDAGAIGRPSLAIQSSSGSGEAVIITPWRHLKRSCGITIDMGVHYTDILEYLLGPIERVTGMGEVVDAERRDEGGAMHPADAEDLMVGVVRFASGALGNLMLNLAGRGASHFQRVVFGTGGSLSIPQDRTGLPLYLTQRRNGQDIAVPEPELLDLVPEYALDATTAALFGGDRLTSYDLPWTEIDANLLAIELDDFAGTIIGSTPPEVTGEQGLRSLALAYGFLESDRLGRAVTIGELLTSNDLPYQGELQRASSGGNT